MARMLCNHGDEVEAMRQGLHQGVTVAKWDQRELFRRIAQRVDAELARVEAFAVDDPGFPNHGQPSVGVQRQCSATLGRIDNGQVAASLHLASEAGGACAGMKLALPKSGAESPGRWAARGIPDDVEHRTRIELSLEMLDDALLSWGLDPLPLIADAGYGDAVAFRDGVVERARQYVVRVNGTAVVWPPGTCPIPPEPKPKGLLVDGGQ